MTHTLFTIGHSNHSIGRFVELLRLHAIEIVCDVRSTPYSRFNPQFNRELLATALEAQGIAYLFLGNELGGKPRDGDYPADDGARFALMAKSERFRSGLERLLKEARGRRTAVMCAEKDPGQCHRGLLICPNLPAGVAIHHILADGSAKDQAELAAERGADDAGQALLF
ncbi:MAG TPA: DUF488 domain-containing protein [Candidatus Methylomirabilis sp.]